MEKKNYMKPNIVVAKLNTRSYLLDVSVTGTTMSGDFTNTIDVGGTTTSADAHSFDPWDDEY